MNEMLSMVLDYRKFSVSNSQIMHRKYFLKKNNSLSPLKKYLFSLKDTFRYYLYKVANYIIY